MPQIGVELMSCHSTRSVFKQFLCLTLIATTLSGCVSGPYWSGEPTIPTPSRAVTGSKVVVSHFMSSDRQISFTSSASVATMLESATVRDISAKIAKGLRDRGIDAEARVDFRVADLQKDQVLLRGGFLDAEAYEPGYYGNEEDEFDLQMAGFILTFFVVGGLIPSPFHHDAGATFRYRAEVIDNEGRILSSIDDGRFSGYYRLHRIHDFGPPGTLPPIAIEKLLDAIASELH